ncbi:MAG: fibronectin type III domain-containing protein [Lachnospiraceae bacterium]|nr:fibronectin type III domain-containing protein [Lachnospiraceae bacterium]MEE0513237.1 fibronectin type III domain-containing protein [Lachnospiraceae bacterium]
MKGFMKKILSAGLAFALVFTMCPVLAYADTPQEAQEKTAETDEPKAETTEVKAESADEKNTVLVYGRIEGSQHWTKDNIYYIITDSTLINPVIIGDLTIDPGTTICFGQGNTSHGKIDQTDVKSASGLRILYGSLTAKGTAEEPIIFKNDTNDENWAGIIFDTQIEEDTERTCEGATFEYCQFINGGEYLASDVEGMLSVDSTSDETDRNFNLTVNQCTFDSSEVVAAKTAAGTSLVDGSSAIYFHAMDRKVEVKVTNSTFRGMGRVLESTGTEYVYPENLSCLVEGNNFESDGYYNNTISEGMSYIEWSANAVVRNNTFHNTTGNELKGPACWLRGGCATYEVEGNHFIGNTDATGENANQYAPLKIRIGANVNADQTKAYAANTCNYGADIGKYAEVVRSTPEQPETITGQTGYLGKIEGLAYRLQGPTVDNARTVTIAPGVTCYMKDLTVESTGKLIAKGTKALPIHFIGENGYYANYIYLNGAWTDGNYEDASAETIFENCTFEKKITISPKLVEINSKPIKELPATLYMKDCQMKDVEKGFNINIRGGSSDGSIASRIELQNVSIAGRGTDGESSDCGIYFWTNYYPDVATLVEVSNCRIYNFTKGVGITAYVSSLDESESAIENAGKQMQLDHLTIVGCNTGILYGCHVLPVIKNSIIAGNTTTLELQGTNAQEDKGKNITYSCLYGTAKDDSLSDYGTGCIAKDPCFADAASGDFHLKSAAGRWNGATWVKDTVTSPCIDAGEASAAYANEPSPNGNRANMGAYGNTAEASKSASGGSTDPSDPGQTCKHTSTEVRNQKAATCTAAGYTGDTYCKNCNKKLSTGKSIAAKGHSTTTKTQKATASKDGKITTTCTRCGTTTKTVKIAKVSKIKLSKTKYTYNGKKQTPSVTVKDSKGKELKVNTDYKVKLPSGRKNVGTYEVKITFKGSKYSGSKTLSYTLNPKSTKLSKVSAKKKGFEAKWKKQSTQTKGYQIQYSTDSKFKSGNKTVTVNKNSTTKKTISKLKAKKKYYVRIRTYKTVGKQKYYSDWSKSVKVTTKK